MEVQAFFWLILLLPDHPLYDVRIDRSRFPPPEQIALMLKINEAYQNHCQSEMALSRCPSRRDWFEQALEEARVLHYALDCLSVHEQDDHCPRWWMNECRLTVGNEWYGAGQVEAIPP